jgi:uncharacterized protein (TIGR02996 family)
MGTSMTDGDALVYAALASPDDRTPRLVLADWLDESGLTDQAEVVRARCALDVLAADHPDRAAFVRRERALYERHPGDWVEHCGLPLTWGQAVALFRRRLAETVAWCNRAEVVMRTPELSPPPIGLEELQAPDRGRTTAERQALVNRLANRRAALLADRGVEPGVGDRRAGGRLLVFYPDSTLSDDAARQVSVGFFDEDNVPAWNTWVWLSDDSDADEALSYRSYLVCWVPPRWVDRADAGIQVNPEQCLRWAADVDIELTRQLRAAGLLI